MYGMARRWEEIAVVIAKRKRMERNKEIAKEGSNQMTKQRINYKEERMESFQFFFYMKAIEREVVETGNEIEKGERVWEIKWWVFFYCFESRKGKRNIKGKNWKGEEINEKEEDKIKEIW